MKYRKFSYHSLTGKLLVLFVIFTILLTFTVGGSMRYALNEHFEHQIRPHLQQYLHYIQTDIGIPPNRDNVKRLSNKLQTEILIHDNTGSWSSSGRKADLQNIIIKHRYIDNGIEYALTEIDSHGSFMMIKMANMTLFFGSTLKPSSIYFVSLLPILILLIILIILYLVTRRLIIPIETIRDSVHRFGEGDLEHRINIYRRDEFGDLATSFNTMADDIQKMLESKRELLLAISHELRSPITRSKVAVELLDNSEQRERLHHDLNEIEKLIEELLETERLSTPHRVLNLSPHSIQGLIKQLVNDFYQKENIHLTLPEENIDIIIDAARIKLLLKNIIDNALRYNPADKPVQITLEQEQKRIELQIRDEGEGIDDKHIPHLSEPFYRVDPARQRETGGYGIGLYLCAMIAKAHGGTLKVTSKKGEGTTVTVKLPL